MSDKMNKTEILKKNYEFRKVLNRGKYYTGQYIEIFLLKNNSDKNLIGIAIGVKIAKAVKRNHIKRLIRENYRLIEENLETGNSIVFLWKKKVNINEATYENIKKDMNYILKKAGIFKNEKSIDTVNKNI